MKFSRLFVAALVLASASAFAQVDPLVVTKSGVDDGTLGTLSFAINYANTTACPVSLGPAPTIRFNLTTQATGPYTIEPPTGGFPPIGCPFTTIDAYTQPSGAASPTATPNTDTGGSTNANIQVILNGTGCTGCDGLVVSASGVTIKGLSIHSFAGAGVRVLSGYGNIHGNYIGTDPGGMNPFPNGIGVLAAGGQINVGSGLDADRNLITGNSGAGIRTTAAATGAFINNNLIGGTRAGGSGMVNGGAGVEFNDTSTHRVYGSYIRYNGGAGIQVNAGDVTAPANPSIFGNGDKAINYISAPPFPAPRVASFLYDSFSNTTSVTVQLSGGPPSMSFQELDVYGNTSLPPFGEGQQLVTTATNFTTDGTGSGTATYTLSGKVDNPTAVFSFCGDGCGPTSEFSTPDLPPKLTLSFTPNPMNVTGTGTLSMVVSNPNKTTRTISQAGFSFTLPSALTIGAETLGADCGTGVDVSGATATSPSAKNITLGPNLTCTITAPIFATAAGTFNFAAGTIGVPSDAGTGTNDAASLTVTFNPPTVSLGSNQTIVGTVASVGVAVSRATSDPNYAGMSTTLSFPAGVTLAATPNVASGCGASVSSTTTSISASGGSLAAPNVGCSLVSAQVQFPGDGTYTFMLNSSDFQLTSPGSYSNPSPITQTITVTTPGATVSPTSLTFGTVAVGSSVTLPVTVKSTGTAQLDITSVTAAGPFTGTGSPCSAVTPGSCTLNVTFSPTAAGTFTGTLTIATNAGAFTVTVSGSAAPTAPAIGLSPTSLTFGLQPVGTTSAAQSITVSNTGNAALDISSVTLAGDFSGSGCAGASIAPGGSCTIAVAFTPVATGPRAGTVTITSNAGGSPHTVNLSGTGGVPSVQLAPSSLTFARQSVGTTSAPQSAVLTNTGTTPLHVTAIATRGDFGYSGCGFPLTLAPGASCTFAITFSPSANGPLTGDITITSDAPGSPHAIALTGTGANGPQPGISLSSTPLLFGNVRVGSQATRVTTISSNGSAPLAIASISTSGGAFSQGNSCPASLPVGGACDITVTFHPTAEGLRTGELVIASNGDPASLAVPLAGNGVPIPPAVLTVDRLLDFGQHIVGTTTRLPLVLGNTGEQALNVTGLQVQGSAFTLEGACSSIAPGGTCTLTLVFSPAAVETFTGRLDIASNDARGTIGVELLGQGLAVPQPEIELSVDGIGFANQLMTTRSTAQAIDVRSVGTAPLHIRGISVTGPFVLSGGCPETLAAGSSCTVSVSFLPLAPGPAEGRLTVDSDAEAGRGFVSLTGSGCRFFSVAANRILARPCGP